MPPASWPTTRSRGSAGSRPRPGPTAPRRRSTSSGSGPSSGPTGGSATRPSATSGRSPSSSGRPPMTDAPYPVDDQVAALLADDRRRTEVARLEGARPRRRARALVRDARGGAPLGRVVQAETATDERRAPVVDRRHEVVERPPPSSCSNGGITSRIRSVASTPPVGQRREDADRHRSDPAAFRAGVNGQWWSPSASDCWSWTTGADRPSSRSQAYGSRSSPVVPGRTCARRRGTAGSGRGRRRRRS